MLQWRTSLIVVIFLACSFSSQAQDLFDINNITEVRIQLPQENWDILLDSLKDAREGDRLLGTLFVNGIRYDSVGVRYKGNSSYNAAKKHGNRKLPFNVKLNHTIKGQELPGGYKRLKLSNGFRDPSFIREVLAYEIARNYMPASRSNFAKVYVNDEYLGVYSSVQSVDDALLDEFFGEHKNTFVKCDPDWRIKQPSACPKGDKASLQFLGQDSACYQGLYEMKSDAGWADLIALTHTLHTDPAQLDTILHVDQALWMLAFDNLLVNLDSYLGAFCHNYYLYKDTTGVWHPIIWDMNLAFGGFRMSGLENNMTDEDMQQMSMFIHYKEQNAKRPLVSKLLKNDLYRKMYVAHIQTMLKEQFSNGKYLERAKALQAQIEAAVLEEEHRLYSEAAFHDNLSSTQDADGTPIVGLSELMGPRIQYLKNHPLMNKPLPKIGQPAAMKKGQMTAINTQVQGADAVYLFFQKPGQGTFRKQEMVASPVNEMEYTAIIPHLPGTKYFFVAETRTNAALLPERASFEFFTVK